jgi:hypothetical protein
VHRFPRKEFIEKIVFRLIFVWPYRCNDCGTRFLDYRSSTEDRRGKQKKGDLSFNYRSQEGTVSMGRHAQFSMLYAAIHSAWVLPTKGLPRLYGN